MEPQQKSQSAVHVFCRQAWRKLQILVATCVFALLTNAVLSGFGYAAELLNGQPFPPFYSTFTSYLSLFQVLSVNAIYLIKDLKEMYLQLRAIYRNEEPELAED